MTAVIIEQHTEGCFSLADRLLAADGVFQKLNNICGVSVNDTVIHVVDLSLTGSTLCCSQSWESLKTQLVARHGTNILLSADVSFSKEVAKIVISFVDDTWSYGKCSFLLFTKNKDIVIFSYCG